jgi:hypothetical protein
MKIQNEKSNKKIIVILLLALIIIAGIFIWQWWQNSNSSPSANSQTPAPHTGLPERTPEADKAADQKTPPPQDTSNEYTVLTENEEYKIRRHNADNRYVITLYAILNRPEQYDAYQQQLSEFKQRALQYLEGQGINSKTANITYEPEEAKNL